MPLNTPSITTIRNRMKSDMELRFQQAGRDIDATTPGTGYTEFCNAIAGVAYSLWSNQIWIANQNIIDRMDAETLVREASYLKVYRAAPFFASGPVVVTGNDGLVIPERTVLQTTSGFQVRTTEEQAITGGTATINVIAMEVGTAGNLSAGTKLSFISPIAGVDSNTVVDTGGLTAGADEETIDRLKARFKERLQKPPKGGTSDDYIAWSKEAHVDVTRAWVFKHENGVGSITVRVVTEALVDPIASPAVVAAVQSYVEDAKPAGLSQFVVEAPLPKPLDLVFNSLSPNTPEVRAAIEAEVKDLLFRDVGPDSTLPISHIRAAISRATGEEDYVITQTSSYTFAHNEYPVLGSTTWPGV